jgi:hypothetical protein
MSRCDPSCGISIPKPRPLKPGSKVCPKIGTAFSARVPLTGAATSVLVRPLEVRESAAVMSANASPVSAKTEDRSAEDPVTNSRLMKGIKIAIVVMGVLIVLGFAAIGLEVYRRATDPEYAAQRGGNPASAPATTTDPHPGSLRGGLTLPGGSVIGDPVAVGNRLAVTVRHPDGTQALYVINPGQGEIIEFIRSAPTP